MTAVDEPPELDIQYLHVVSCNTEYHALTDADDEEMGDDAWSIILE